MNKFANPGAEVELIMQSPAVLALFEAVPGKLEINPNDEYKTIAVYFTPKEKFFGCYTHIKHTTGKVWCVFNTFFDPELRGLGMYAKLADVRDIVALHWGAEVLMSSVRNDNEAMHTAAAKNQWFICARGKDTTIYVKQLVKNV